MATPAAATIALDAGRSRTSSDTVTIGLRPEHLVLCDEGRSGRLKGRVVHKENLGADIYLHASMNDGAHRLVVRAAPIDGVAVSIGQDVAFKRHHGAAMVFEAGGKRMAFR
jgi:multiple sugar transport system ATP-binding protein